GLEENAQDDEYHHGIFFFQAEDGIRDGHVTGVQTCALPISAFPVTAAKILVCISGFDIIILTGSPAQPERAAALNAIKITRASFRAMSSSSVRVPLPGRWPPHGRVSCHKVRYPGKRGSSEN